MAESTCVMHAFTFPSYETKQIGQVHELHESVSFGRFATETLAWDKWSSFSSKHYVEEAAKHSQPGLVASKKAFFEAYYKKKGLLEQQDSDEGNYTKGSNAEDKNLNGTHPCLETALSEVQGLYDKQYSVENSETDSGIYEKTNIQVHADPVIDNEPLDAKHKETSKMELLTCTKENMAILRDVKTNQKVSEAGAEKLLPACLPPPCVLRVSSKRDCSAKGPRVSFGASTSDIALCDMPENNVSDAEGLPTSKADPMLKPSATACIEAKSTKMLLDSPASKSRSDTTDQTIFTDSTKSSPESKSPTTSVPRSRPAEINLKTFQIFEDISNQKASKSARLQTKIKEKAASQLKKLRQSFCFCYKPSHDQQNGRQTLKNHTKLERHETLLKNRCWTHVEKQRSQRQIRPGSLGEKIAVKGKSPVAQNL